jgi:hypothetical protein
MPVWLSVVLAVCAIAATLSAAPLVMHVMRRPKVKFQAKPAAFWSIVQAGGESTWIYCVIHLALRNDGNEATHITQTNLTLTPSLSASFDFDTLSALPNDGLIDRNGGRLEHRMVYRLKRPLPYRQSRGGVEAEYFNEPFAQFGRSTITASQNKRLLWGEKTVQSEIKAEHVDEATMREWVLPFLDEVTPAS